MAEEKVQAAEFKPYVAETANVAEFTPRAVILGMLFGIIFGAVTVYVGLRAGLTVSASIPIAVLSISLLRALGKATILENNIVQTTGSAGESVAGGVIFTLPALIFLGFPLEYSRIFLLALIGGWLGVLFMIPLRRQLIVKEHGNLLYPEGTACADVLVAGDKGGSFASRVFYGLGLGGVYTLLQNENAFAALNPLPTYNPTWLPGASLRAAITPEYLGVGYIIGPRIAGVIFAGGVFSWLVMMPAIKFFGGLVPTPIYPEHDPDRADDVGRAVALLHPLHRRGRRGGSGPDHAAQDAADDLGCAERGRSGPAQEDRRRAPRPTSRTARDLPTNVVLVGSLAIVAAMWALLTFKPVPGAPTGLGANLLASLLVVIFGFLFVTVSSRIVGLIGTSVEPDFGHGDRHADGHLRAVPARRLDCAGLRRAGALDRRHGLHRGRERRQHLAGPEDRLPGGRHTLGPAEGPVPRRAGVVLRDRHDPDRDEQGAREVRAGGDRDRRRATRRTASRWRTRTSSTRDGPGRCST